MYTNLLMIILFASISLPVPVVGSVLMSSGLRVAGFYHCATGTQPNLAASIPVGVPSCQGDLSDFQFLCAFHVQLCIPTQVLYSQIFSCSHDYSSCYYFLPPSANSEPMISGLRVTGFYHCATGAQPLAASVLVGVPNRLLDLQFPLTVKVPNYILGH